MNALTKQRKGTELKCQFSCVCSSVLREQTHNWTEIYQQSSV